MNQLIVGYARYDRLQARNKFWQFVDRCGFKGCSIEVDNDEDKEEFTITKIKGIAMPTENNMYCEVQK